MEIKSLLASRAQLLDRGALVSSVRPQPSKIDFDDERRRRNLTSEQPEKIDLDEARRRRNQLIEQPETYSRAGMVRRDPSDVSTGSATKEETPPSVFGDFDGNGVIDGSDLGTLLGEFGTKSKGSDLDGNGLVDSEDLNLLLGAWERQNKANES